MRQVDPKIVEERKKKILQAVIHHYIKTAKPVSSQVLTSDYHFKLSAATLRSLMAELEDEGYLTHPHTSAGRVPTDKGYRLYVDSLMEMQRLVIEEEERVRHEYHGKIKEMEGLLVQTSHVLSALSQYTGFVLAPKPERNQLKYLELIQIENKKILVILVTHTGMVKHHMLEVSSPLSPEKMLTLNHILNDKLRGLTLTEARERIIEKIEESEREEKEILTFARALSQQIFDVEDKVFVEGASNILSIPEFQDYEPMRSILRIGEERHLLDQILDTNLDSDKIKVMIGSETSCQEFRQLSVVSTVYKNGKNPVGVLGIIGPRRMEYQKMMALVGAVSKMVNKMLSKLGG